MADTQRGLFNLPSSFADVEYAECPDWPRQKGYSVVFFFS